VNEPTAAVDIAAVRAALRRVADDAVTWNGVPILTGHLVTP